MADDRTSLSPSPPFCFLDVRRLPRANRDNSAPTHVPDGDIRPVPLLHTLLRFTRIPGFGATAAAEQRARDATTSD